MKKNTWGLSAMVISIVILVILTGLGFLYRMVRHSGQITALPVELLMDTSINRYLASSKKITGLLDSLNTSRNHLSAPWKISVFYQMAPVCSLMEDKQLLTLNIGTSNARERNDLVFGVYQDSCRGMNRQTACEEAVHFVPATNGSHPEEVFIVRIYRQNGFHSRCNSTTGAVRILEITHADSQLRALGFSLTAVLAQT